MNTPPPPPSANNLPMPQWAYVPGEMVEDDADHETLWKAKSLVPSRFRDYVPARHPALRYGIALNERGYFWESQEVLEAVWAAAPQGGRERILLRACILIANANLRLRIQKPTAASRLLGEALQELDALKARKAAAAGDGFADGFPIEALIALLKARLARPQLTKADWVAFSAVGRG
jgi:predicted metal-dependent hydrolase